MLIKFKKLGAQNLCQGVFIKVIYSKCIISLQIFFYTPEHKSYNLRWYMKAAYSFLLRICTLFLYHIWSYLLKTKLMDTKFSDSFVYTSNYDIFTSLGNLKTIICWKSKIASQPLRWVYVVTNEIPISLSILTNIIRIVDFRFLSSLCWMSTSKKISSCG